MGTANRRSRGVAFLTSGRSQLCSPFGAAGAKRAAGAVWLLSVAACAPPSLHDADLLSTAIATPDDVARIRHAEDLWTAGVQRAAGPGDPRRDPIPASLIAHSDSRVGLGPDNTGPLLLIAFATRRMLARPDLYPGWTPAVLYRCEAGNPVIDALRIGPILWRGRIVNGPVAKEIRAARAATTAPLTHEFVAPLEAVATSATEPPDDLYLAIVKPSFPAIVGAPLRIDWPIQAPPPSTQTR